MTSGYYAACTGLVARTEALDSIANNLANASTNGFRARHTVFRAMLNTASGDSGTISMLNQDMNDYGVLSGTRLDKQQGSLERTGNYLDVALEGPAYLTVKSASGATAYTRGGSLRISSDRRLVTAQGDEVQGDNGPITVLGAPVDIAPDGTLSYQGVITGHIKLAEFADSADLDTKGGGYYTTDAKPTGLVHTTVRQGYLESSNVNPVMSTVELIQAQREVETMRRVLSLFNGEMDRTAAQDLPHVNAS